MKTLLHGHRGTKSAARQAIYCASIASLNRTQFAVAFVMNWSAVRALLATVVMLGAVDALAATRTWLPASPAGDWSTALKWSGNLAPTVNDTAYIVNGGTANVTQLGQTCGTLSLGGGGGGTVLMTAGGLSTIGNESIGASGNGIFAQSDGTHSVSNSLFVGDMASGSGTYNLSGGSLSASFEYIGNSGSGIFTQSGGTNTVHPGGLILGNGGNGSYTLGGSTGAPVLSAAGEFIGYSGTRQGSADGQRPTP